MKHSPWIIALRQAAPALLAAGALALTGCFQSEPRGKDGDSLSLTGRVVSSNDGPVAGVVVRLAVDGGADTTDATGRYHLTGKKGGKAGGVVLDTLYYSKGGLALARVSVTSWTDSLPDVEVVQRDISGLLDSGSGAVGRVEAILTGDGIDSASPVVAQVYYNTLTGNYSGFMYFPPAATVRNYSVRVNVYGPDSLLAGRSVPVPFNSFAGNITVPAFKSGNAKPAANAGTDSVVASGATVMLHGAAVDSFGGTITKWEWSIGGGSFVQTSSSDTSFTRGSMGAYPCILRVTDNDGNKALDTVVATVLSHGTTWTTRSSGTTSSLTSVVWTGTQFVAVGSGATAVTSPDGITWTARVIDNTSPPSLSDVAWNGRKLMAVTTSSGLQENVYTSTDGITWTPGRLTPPVISGSPLRVSAVDTAFIVAGVSGTTRLFLKSTNDGSTWTVDSIPREPAYVSSIWSFAKHADRIVGVGTNGVAASAPASGGAWVRHTNSDTYPPPDGGVYDYTMMSVISTGAHAVAVGYAGHVMRSVDGTTWQQPRIVGNIPRQSSGSSKGNLMDVVWTGDLLVAVGNDYTVVSADDGANWAMVQSATGPMYSVAWNGTRLVAVGSGGKIVTSE
jgi:hypothetical protein